MKILVADDSAISRRLLEKMLERLGYEVELAVDGQQALGALMRADGPRLAVVDWMMPGMDGLEVLKRLRAEPATKDVPVVLYSAVDNPDLIGQAKQLGAQDCVLKSGGFYSLYERIERHVH